MGERGIAEIRNQMFLEGDRSYWQKRGRGGGSMNYADHALGNKLFFFDIAPRPTEGGAPCRDSLQLQ